MPNHCSNDLYISGPVAEVGVRYRVLANTRKELDDELGAVLVDDVLEYLDELRESGVTNMWGVPAYVQKEYKMSGVTEQQSLDLTTFWMDTFSERHPE